MSFSVSLLAWTPQSTWGGGAFGTQVNQGEGQQSPSWKFSSVKRGGAAQLTYFKILFMRVSRHIFVLLLRKFPGLCSWSPCLICSFVIVVNGTYSGLAHIGNYRSPGH